MRMCFPHFRLLAPFRLEVIKTHVTGTYCLPLAACIFNSVTAQGRLSEGVDVSGNVAWDATRLNAQHKAAEMRLQGFVGPAMLPIQELEYSAFRHSLAGLEEEFELRGELGNIPDGGRPVEMEER